MPGFGAAITCPLQSGFSPGQTAGPGAVVKKNCVSFREIRGLIFRMNIQTAVLCDAATQDASSKLNLLGAFDTICAPQLPVVHPQCAVALRITFMSGDEGRHQLALNFINADGRSIMPAMNLPINVVMPEDTHFVTLNFVISFQQLHFPEAGLYSVDVRLDGESRAAIPLQIKLLPQPPTA
jgi:Family of unknown function (DUF6941)